MPAPQTPAAPPQIQMQFERGWRYEVPDTREPPRVYDAGSRYYVKVEVARQAFLAGAAKPAQPLETISVQDAGGLVRGWEQQLAAAEEAKRKERAKLDDEQTRAREAAAAATQPPEPAPAAAHEEA